MPKFAVKSWEDKILGALVRCRRKRIKDHATLKKQGFGLVFFCFFIAPSWRSRREKTSIICLSSAHTRRPACKLPAPRFCYVIF
ncbi:hypothetical protein CEJ86_14200 [Sinorhizobium meliloti]|uniref:Uncharacterized protein n=1 Tax=Rhizobium meliloti TaxID=382 RepID=A0A2J0Z361_RHIML|nr:hypothetical protein CEJ86_14200 [Sinorhizobium meliloti]